MRRDKAIQLLISHRPELTAKYGVQKMSLFGSVARDEAGEASDVDLLVEFNRPTGLFGLFALQDRLEEVLGCPIDLGTPASLKPRIRSRVLAECVDVA